MLSQKLWMNIFLILALLMLLSSQMYSQKVAFVNSDVIREKFTEAQQADTRIKSIVEDWKREISALDKQIQDTEFEIKKNRLVWSDEEKAKKDKELDTLKFKRLEFARQKFETGGEYEASVKTIMTPIEEKIYASIQEVAADEGFDIIWDKSVLPLAYSNSKFDMTVKVLRKLGVDVKKLEDELKEKIEKDPRNKQPESKGPPRSRSREKGAQQPSKEFEKDPNQQNPQNPQQPSELPKK